MTTPDYPVRLATLRREISFAGFDGFLVPMSDEYQNEYVPPCAQRVGFLSGFTGSAGYIVVLKNKAAFFTDSRYTLQAAKQVPAALYEIYDSADKLPLAWVQENIGKGARIAYDPWLHSAEGVDRLKAALAKVDAVAVPVARNLVDVIWDDRPAAPAAPVVPHELAYAGKSSAEKRAAIAALLQKKNLSAAIITDVCSVAWLLNVRGGDVANTPLPLSRAILRDDGTAQWFIDPRKVSKTLVVHVGDQVSLLPPEDFPAALASLAATGKAALVDPATASSWIVDCLHAAKVAVEFGEDPCELPKAIKNVAELDGIRAAHRRDGAALARFFAWLDGVRASQTVTELGVEEQLASFRAANANYRGPSFDTIAGAGEHGAIVHYRATTESDAPLQDSQLFLLDSGGQYLDGTTDVTRTVALGAPTDEMRERFTRVLKGHIALASVRFPEGTTGADLDVLARQHLWAVGLDYGHGTGHGVGCYLGVHEGPQAISKRSKVPLVPGMVVSNEPGYYKAGHYGIRIESLLTVVEALGMTESTRKIYGFETLTLAPIDRRLIDPSLMTAPEIAWLNAYHLRVRQVVSPMVDAATAAWLEAATQPIEK